MKRNIYDLLDTYFDESVDLDSNTPLSSSRIKELTMSRVNQKKPPKPHFSMRILVVAATIAAFSISALAVSYILGAGIFFRDLFEKDGNTLTDGQIGILDQIGKNFEGDVPHNPGNVTNTGTSFEGGIACNGATITPIAALADENVYYLRLRIEAPDEMVLTDLDERIDGYYQLFGMSDDEKLTLVQEGSEHTSLGWNLQIIWMPDNDSTDNVKEVVLRYTMVGDAKFNDGVSKLLTIHGLWIQSPDKGYTPIFTGEFTFDIGMHYDSLVIPLDCKGASWHNVTYAYTNTLESLELSPLSLSFRFKTTLPDNHQIRTGLGPIEIVLKDGSKFTGILDEHAHSRSNTPASSHDGYIVFNEPLDLTQVDYVQYGDYKIPVENE